MTQVLGSNKAFPLASTASPPPCRQIHKLSPTNPCPARCGVGGRGKRNLQAAARSGADRQRHPQESLRPSGPLSSEDPLRGGQARQTRTCRLFQIDISRQMSPD